MKKVRYVVDSQTDGTKELKLRWESRSDGALTILVDGFYVVQFQADGTLLRVHSIPTHIGLALDDEGRIRTVDQ